MRWQGWARGAALALAAWAAAGPALAQDMVGARDHPLLKRALRDAGILLLCWLLAAAPAGAGTEVRIVDTWPRGDEVTVAPNQTFYLLLAYDSDRPVHLWARPFWHGSPVDAGSNPSRLYSGSGEALAWFFLWRPGQQVDEVRITAGDGTRGGSPLVAVWRGQLRAEAGAREPPDAPEWLAQLNERERAAQRADDERRMSEPLSASDAALGMGFMWTVLALLLIGLAAPVWALWRWRGGWRLLAALPALWMAFVLLRILIGVWIDPTSHNLWPFEILISGGACALVIGVLGLLRRFMGAEEE